MLKRVNVEKQLVKERNNRNEFISNVVSEIFENVTAEDDKILNKLTEQPLNAQNNFNPELLLTKNIYHINTIEKICVDYRLRFLDSNYFKGDVPYEAILKIKTLEKEHNIALSGFKIMAPSKLFRLKNADDPLLFAPIGNGYYYLIHKWGNDLSPFRKLAMWPFKTFENLLVLIVVTSILATYLFPMSLLTKQEETLQEYILLFFFMFKAVAAIVLYYGFAKGKNFNTAIWNSAYSNA